MPTNVEKKESRTIRLRGFSHDVLVPHPFEPGKDMINRRFALRGQTVELLPHDIARG
jgi:hypothetical protein